MPLATQTYIASVSTANPIGQTIPTGTALSGHRAVCIFNGSPLYADNTISSHAVRPVGLTTSAATIGSQAEIVWSGRIVEPSWSWTPDAPIFLGTGGFLTQVKPTAPSAVFLKYLGTADSATSIILDPQPPVIL